VVRALERNFAAIGEMATGSGLHAPPMGRGGLVDR
jgi:hypothetical protein